MTHATVARLLGSFTAILAAVLCAGTGAAQSPIQLEYRYKEADSVRYRLNLRHDVEDTRDGERTRASIKRQFEYVREVQAVNSETGAGTVNLRLEQCSFDGGTPGQAFDSRKPDQLQQVKTNPRWALFGAILSSRSRVRLTTTGKVDFFRVTDVDKSYDEKVQGLVARVLEENVTYLTAPLPSSKIAPGSSWSAAIPMKFVGGLLHGNVVHLNAEYNLERIEVVGGERVAHVRVRLGKQPTLNLSEDSLQGLKPDFNVDDLSGRLLFSLDRSNVVEYAMNVRTRFKLSAQGQSVNEHQMTYEFTVNRL